MLEKKQPRNVSDPQLHMKLVFPISRIIHLFLLFQVDDPAMEGIKKPIRTGKTPKQYRQFVISVMQILPRVINKPVVHILTFPVNVPPGQEPKKMKMRKKLSNYSRNQCMAEEITRISECALGCLFKRAFCQEM